MLKQPWYPGIIVWPTFFIFGFIVYQLLFGPDAAHDNFGTAATWVLWWPLIPLIFLLLGRFWCAICPFATLSDLVQKVVGLNGPVPKFLKKYGIWLIDFFFILITWADHVWGIVESPWGSGILLLMLVTGVVISGAFWERRTWCRYLCFLGGLSSNYARAGAVELRATPDICKDCKTASCFKGNGKVPGCPMFEFPRTMDTNARCNYCGYCVKSCPNDSIQVSLRVPTRELWFIRKPSFEESFLAIVIVGIVFIQNITMLDVWGKMLAFLENLTGTSNYAVIFTIAFLIAMGSTVALLFITSFFAKKTESTTVNFARFGYALIPLDLAGHLAHNLFHLLAEGKSIFYTFIALFTEMPEGSPALVSNDVIQLLQFALIGLGVLGSIYTVYRIAKYNYQDDFKRPFLVHTILVILLGILNIYLFTLPMMSRM
ncbi:4Fe-4S binding protein [Thermanaerosceptrum fracticalcis]|uniref:4Fe-4S binding protein n=1 Tax=Thermanaerosceptrum fracticalcis TaxID=1712410 RepID=A0A7G6E8J2_THEFR|nr:4Fe-4S binding protein [Thermanaerosceptrum fracticalcis]